MRSCSSLATAGCEITLQREGLPDVAGNYRTLASSDFGGGFTSIVRCKRSDGSNAAPADERTHIRVQNTGAAVQVWIEGELCGNYPQGQRLEIHNMADRRSRPRRTSSARWTKRG